MTVIQPNSITGINSITVQTGQALNVHDASGNLIRNITSSTGISTFQSVTVTSGDLIVGTSDLFVDNSTGHIGMGTEVPTDTGGYGRALDIKGGASGAAIYLRSTNGDTGQIALGSADLTIRTRQADPIIFNTNNAEKLRITSAGLILIGTTSDVAPDSFGSKLQIDSGNAAGSIALGRHTASASGPALLFHKSRSGSTAGGTIVLDDDNLGTIRFHGADGTDRNSYGAEIKVNVDGTPGSNDLPGRIEFATTADGASSPTERLRIDSAGRIGIGTTNPDVFYANNLVIQVADEKGVTLVSNAGTLGANENNYIMFASTNSGAGRYDGYVRYGHQSHSFLVSVNNGGGSGKNFTFESDGDFNIGDGNLVVANGHGIDFSAMSDTESGAGSATSEVLDDYEFGTWTPAYQSTGGTYGYSTQEGWYCKVGKFVTVRAYIATDSVSASSHNLVKVTGLPFQVAYRTPGSIRCNGFQSSGTLEGFPSAWSFEHNQTHGELQRFNANGNTDFTSSTFNSSTHVYLAGTYKID